LFFINNQKKLIKVILRDSCFAKEKKLVEEDYFQLDFLADLFDIDKNS